MLHDITCTDNGRRDFIKELIALSAAAIIPIEFNFLKQKEKRLHFIGLGGAGTNVVMYFYHMGVKGKYTCITNPERLNFPSEIKLIKFIPPQQNCHKNMTEAFNILNMHRKIEIPNSVLNIFKSNDKFILLSGLGGYTGTCMTIELTWLLQDNRKNFMTICSLPFIWEGRKRKSCAEYVIKQLEIRRNFKYFELDDMIKKYGPHISLLEAFKKSDEQFYNTFTKFCRS